MPSKISIHAPHAGCDLIIITSDNLTFTISIHASHAGCDPLSLWSFNYARIFQSTHPMRGATLRQSEGQCNPQIFQSTHPMRGATTRLLLVLTH